MKSNVKILSIALGLALAASVWKPAPANAAALEPADRETVEIAIALDTSGTMRPLIDSARVKLWEIIEDLGMAEPTPRVRVALLTFGNQRGSRASGWVRVEADLTEDVDLISQKLFALKGRGADEYVGRVLQAAVERLSWSDSALKLLFVAGNESADQDPNVGFREMSEAARQSGILVSAIYCGPGDAPEAESWKEMAYLSEGQFAPIDHRLPAVLITTPLDEQLVELGDLLNETYVPYGSEGKEAKKSRASQDKNARKQGTAVAASRAIAKASPVYTFAGDLVSAYEQGSVDPVALEPRDLPRSMRSLPAEERALFVQDMSEIRAELRSKISELAAERRRIIRERSGDLHARSEQMFDQVVRRTIREKAEEYGFYFPEE